MLTVKRVDSEVLFKKALDIRHEVFVLEQKVPPEEEYDQHDATANHYLVLMKQDACGAGRWRVTENGAKLERFAVLKSFRRQGVASALLSQMLKDIKSQKSVQRIYLNAQVAAIPLYAKHGFEPVGQTFDECNILHQQMEMMV